jgi:hypothetical protein
MIRTSTIAAAVAAFTMTASSAWAQSGGGIGGWFSGNWYLKVGGAVLHKPKFEGADGRSFAFQPMISLGKAGGNSARFTSRNDNISLAFVDTGTFRAGAAGKLVFRRDGDTDGRLNGLSPVRFGGELGGFAEVYPTDNLRMRGEVRHGIRSHSGVVVDLSADLFHDVTDTIQISAGAARVLGVQQLFRCLLRRRRVRIRGDRSVPVQSRQRIQVVRRRRRGDMESDRPARHQPVRRILETDGACREIEPRSRGRFPQPVHDWRVGRLPLRLLALRRWTLAQATVRRPRWSANG